MVQERLQTIFRTVFCLAPDADVPGLSMENHPAWDSMAHINLLLSVEQEFRVSLSPEEVAEAVSFERLQELIAQKI
ncbi:MAG: acyl carrier protein [Candidatus Eisenbacteria bacterium]